MSAKIYRLQRKVSPLMDKALDQVTISENRSVPANDYLNKLFLSMEDLRKEIPVNETA